MILFLNHVFVAIGIVNLLYFGAVRSEVEMTNIAKQAKERIIDELVECPAVNSKHPIILPHPHECAKFYICDHGVRHLKECQSGLHFNPNIKTCDYPEKSKCDRGNPTKDKTTGDKSSLCPAGNSVHPVLIPHPEDCSQFYMCDGGSAHLKQCHPGLHFSQKVKTCDYPEKAECDTAFKELPKGKKNGDDLNLCPAEISTSKYPVLLPHPEDCSKFYICSSGSAHSRECQQGLHFNPKINSCDYPKNAKCDAGARIALSGVPSPFCPPVNGKTLLFFRNLTNCSVYYMCSHGLAYEFTCPSRLHFNIRNKVCDYEWKAGCQNSN